VGASFYAGFGVFVVLFVVLVVCVVRYTRRLGKERRE
jgi:membrane protein implicated in regulation of membrane protease activity